MDVKLSAQEDHELGQQRCHDQRWQQITHRDLANS
jgi:hypothetical protein